MLYFFINYIGYFIGALIQIVFILLPVTLKNWEDDFINSLSYIAFQIFVAGLIFIISPWVLEVEQVSLWTQTFLVVGTAFIASFRTIRIIPFEFADPVKRTARIAESLIFDKFYTDERRDVLESFDFQKCDGLLRYNALREKLIRLKNAKEEDDEDDEG
ncbi:MAG: hypothetical protein V4591_06525 [Bdellovibrionota bacterium]